MALAPMRPMIRGIQKILGVRRQKPPVWPPNSSAFDPAEPPLAWLGFPQVAMTAFFPSAEVGAQLRAAQLLSFPPLCCMCGAAAHSLLAPAQLRGWLGRTVPGPLTACIPHCEAHAQRQHAGLLVLLHPTDAPAYHVTLIGFHARFLEQTHELNTQGPAWPPWFVFPHVLPESGGWRQGDGESWRTTSWQPFWDALDLPARRAYLDRWNAPAEWRAWLDIEQR